MSVGEKALNRLGRHSSQTAQRCGSACVEDEREGGREGKGADLRRRPSRWRAVRASVNVVRAWGHADLRRAQNLRKSCAGKSEGASDPGLSWYAQRE